VGNIHFKWGRQQKPVTHPTLIYWWATKTRYPPYIDTIGGQQKYVTRWATLILNGAGNKNPLPTLHFKRWATLILNGAGNKNPLPTLH